jgi:hypothetical protein
LKSGGFLPAGVQILLLTNRFFFFFFFFFLLKKIKKKKAVLAEWSKALRSGRNLFGGVGSNPTGCND